MRLLGPSEGLVEEGAFMAAAAMDRAAAMALAFCAACACDIRYLLRIDRASGF